MPCKIMTSIERGITGQDKSGIVTPDFGFADFQFQKEQSITQKYSLVIG